MKNILVMMFCVFLFGCDEPRKNSTSIPCVPDIENPATPFEYNGHKYIKFQYAKTFAGDSGTVHDPDCPCMKGKK